MVSTLTTPEKNFDILATPAPDTAQRTLSACIFSTSDRKRNRSRNSEKRYTQNAQLFDELLQDSILDEPIEIKASKLLDYTEGTSPHPPPTHHRQGSHQRKRSICIAEEIPADKLIQEIVSQVKKQSPPPSCHKKPHEESNSNAPSRNQSPRFHTRNVSDADSVIYMGFEDITNSKNFTQKNYEKLQKSVLSSQETVINKSMKKLRNDENVIETKKSVKKSMQSYDRAPLPVLGNMPSSVYCNFCKMYVHSKVDFLNAKVPGPILKVFSSFFTCCQVPAWLNTYRVHRCPNCTLVLAKSR